MTKPLSRSTTLDLALPERPGRGRMNAERQAVRDAAVQAWCERLIELKARIDFDPGPRGWCYILEEHGLTKGDFGPAQNLIVACRKQGMLPIDFTSGDDDAARADINVENLDNPNPEDNAKSVLRYVDHAHDRYEPVSFWEFQDCYVEMLVEKIGLRNLFEDVCNQYHVRLANAKGTAATSQLINRLRRFAKWQEKGKHCVVLYCGDHDPAGLRISNALRSNFEDWLSAFRQAYPEHEGFDFDDVVIERFGLNYDFIRKHRLSWTKGLVTASGMDLGDPDHYQHKHRDIQAYIKKFGERKVEADTLVVRPEAGRALCESAIMEYVNRDGIEKWQRAQRKKQREMRRALDRLLTKRKPKGQSK